MDSENNGDAASAATNNSGNKMSPMIIGVIALVVIAIAGGLFFVMGNKNQAGEDSMAPVEEVMTDDTMEESTEGATMEDGDIVSVTMEAGSFYFKPNTISAKLGQTVRVTVNSVSMQHDFVIDELGVKSAVLPSGKSETVEFVASEVGNFEFYCSIGNHKQQGMVGVLTVTE